MHHTRIILVFLLKKKHNTTINKKLRYNFKKKIPTQWNIITTNYWPDKMHNPNWCEYGA